jgi:hypothetical protein
MPSAREVTPGAWSDVLVVYDDGKYSAIWARYKQNAWRSLGVGWNGKDDEVGFPNTRGYPQWYVEPDFLVPSVLRALREKLLATQHLPNREHVLKSIEYALAEVR